YDVLDYGDSVHSAMRGHSLARTMYGWNYRSLPTADYDPAYYADPASVLTANQVAFNGVGPLRTPFTFGAASYRNDDLVNYQAFAAFRGGRLVLTDGFVRDPERLGARASLDQRPDLSPAGGANFAGGFNVPYTFP